jgi:hypothetical protein
MCDRFGLMFHQTVKRAFGTVIRFEHSDACASAVGRPAAQGGKRGNGSNCSRSKRGVHMNFLCDLSHRMRHQCTTSYNLISLRMVDSSIQLSRPDRTSSSAPLSYTQPSPIFLAYGDISLHSSCQNDASTFTAIVPSLWGISIHVVRRS